MNIYARYFDHETVVHSLDELFDFLASLHDINVDAQLIDELTAYVNSDITYPKRHKVRPRVYFILIKTTANSLDEFKANNKNTSVQSGGGYPPAQLPRKDTRSFILQEENDGWYFGRINFKRVLLIPGTQKFQYRDTTFAAYVRATSPMDCYARIIDHLKNRQDVDPRSQFPSAKGSNFVYEFIGEQLPIKSEGAN